MKKSISCIKEQNDAELMAEIEALVKAASKNANYQSHYFCMLAPWLKVMTVIQLTSLAILIYLSTK